MSTTFENVIRKGIIIHAHLSSSSCIIARAIKYSSVSVSADLDARFCQRERGHHLSVTFELFSSPTVWTVARSTGHLMSEASNFKFTVVPIHDRASYCASPKGKKKDEGACWLSICFTIDRDPTSDISDSGVVILRLVSSTQYPRHPVCITICFHPLPTSDISATGHYIVS